jgi:transcriptional regulator with XRE-family HTH domain
MNMKTLSQNTNTFGDFFRAKRISLGYTLRNFCEKFNFDPGNISRLERNILPPSVDEEKLEGYAQAIQIAKDSPDWVQFFDFAHIARGYIPKDLRKDPKIMSFLPAFYRTVRGEKLNKKKIEQLVNLLNKENANRADSK